jgi:arylsulfatase A
MPAIAAERAADSPNIVIILADDMGFGDLACQNPETKIPTPNLDRLASQGMRFTDAHSPSAVCTPTRYSILTGDYCWRTELQSRVLWSWDGPLIDADKLTLGGLLQSQGYSTACIGKWHLGWEWPAADGSSVNDLVALGVNDQQIRAPFGDKIDFTKPIEGGPITRGFDYYFGDDVPNFPPYCFIENDRTVGIPSVPKPKEMFGADGPMLEGWDLTAVMPAITRRSVKYIEKHDGDTPFFLYMPLTAPHTPIAPMDEFIGMSDAHRYGDFVVQVDWTAGEIMAALERSGQADNTLLIFTSDNGSPGRSGENMQGPANSVREYGHNPSHIYRGIKTDIWEGGHRVPFLVRWPGRVRAGAVNDEPICHVDLMATVAAVTEYDLPNDTAVDSYNLLPVFEEKDYAKPLREAIVHHSLHGVFAIRQGRWKLILDPGSGGWFRDVPEDAPPVQLYDMHEDPGEQTNVQAEHPRVVERLTALLQQYRESGRSIPARER